MATHQRVPLYCPQLSQDLEIYYAKASLYFAHCSAKTCSIPLKKTIGEIDIAKAGEIFHNFLNILNRGDALVVEFQLEVLNFTR